MRSASPERFRSLLSHFASGVTVLTAIDAQDQVAGMTASAVTSVSLDPPLLLVCVNHDDHFHEVLTATSTFAINVLARNQETLSRQFAGDADHRFHNVRYREGPGGLPLLEGVVASIICERWSTIPAGDHTVFVGRVMDGTESERPPLLHFRGAYAGLDPRAVE